MEKNIEKIKELKNKKEAIILAHNYEPPEIQDIADMCGDSLELSIKASKTDAKVIVFCGVKFMAETAFILSPDKTVILPHMDAGCPMAEMVQPDQLKNEMKKYGDIPIVTYVNSNADVKALSTICCTSANAVKVVNSLDSDEILMLPDRNLAQYTASKTDKKIHLWEGFCPFHNNLKPEDVLKAKEKYPNALFIAHPECPPEIIKMADRVESTSGMIKFSNESKHKEFIVGTEVGLIYPLQKASPDKKFYPASIEMECIDMKKITIEDIASSLELMNNQVTVPEDLRVLAYNAVKRMIDIV